MGGVFEKLGGVFEKVGGVVWKVGGGGVTECFLRIGGVFLFFSVVFVVVLLDNRFRYFNTPMNICFS